MKICVLQPDYSTTGIDYQHYDPPRNLSPLLPGTQVDHLFLNKLTTYKQLKEAAANSYDCFVNLCEGYLHWEVPSVDVIYSLHLLGLPYTGPTADLYDPAKELMKYVAYTEGIPVPAYALLNKGDVIEEACALLSYPLFIKPAHAGDSLGIDEASLVYDASGLQTKVQTLWAHYSEVLVEEYIDGREFTVLVAANAEPYPTCTVFAPVEYVFPAGKTFKTYALKTAELHPNCNRMVTDASLSNQLKEAAQRIFNAFSGVGYARLDFRMNKDGVLFFLEINFTCSVFYTGGYEGSADYILLHDGIGQSGFLKHIIAEGIERRNRHKKRYVVKGSPIAGYGIYAAVTIQKGEVIFRGEDEPHRLVTKAWVDKTWTAAEQKTFRQYAWPISHEVYVIWNKDPSIWAPQNHSCNANTAYDGLQVVAVSNIEKGEELTLDYASFLDEQMAPFVCRCGAVNCRQTISGTKNNSVTTREKQKES